jgi:hypothetical protein
MPSPAVTCAAEVPVFEVTGWLMTRLGPDVLLDVVVGCYMLRMLVSSSGAAVLHILAQVAAIPAGLGASVVQILAPAASNECRLAV